MIDEAMECLGGDGYVEESILPRLYREAPVNAIWEGSGNVICLDVLRAIVREPDSVPAFFAELRRDARRRRAARRRDRASWRRSSRSPRTPSGGHGASWSAWPSRCRRRCWCAPRRRRSPTRSCASRLEAPRLTFGALPAGLDLEPLLVRALPA